MKYIKYTWAIIIIILFSVVSLFGWIYNFNGTKIYIANIWNNIIDEGF